MFDRNFVYPSDNVGFYIKLEGTISEVSKCFDGWKAAVKTDKGTFTGYGEYHMPCIGYLARIRIYDSGGGFYPDNSITGWSKK